MGSEPGKFDSKDLVAVLKTAAWVGAGAGVVAFSDTLLSGLSGVDMGSWSLVLIPVVTAALKGLKEWVSDNTGK